MRHFAVAVMAMIVTFAIVLVVRALLSSKKPVIKSPQLPQGKVVSVRHVHRKEHTDSARSQPPRTVEIEKREKVFFRVVDVVTGKDVKSAAVTLVTSEDRREIEREESLFTLKEPPDAGTLEGEAPGYFRLAIEVSHLLPTEESFLFLVPAETLLVHCISEDTREPVSAAYVSLIYPEIHRDREPPPVETDDDGWTELAEITLFSSSRPSVATRIQIEVEAQGFLGRTVRVPVRPGTDWAQLQVLLKPSQETRIQVVDRDSGAGVPYATAVHTWDYENTSIVNDQVKVVQTDAEGRLRLEVRKGANGLQVVVAHPDYATKGVRVEDLDSLGEKELLVELEAGYDIEGFVVSEDGEPVRKVMADLDPLDRADYSQWASSSSHRYLNHLPDMAGTDSEGRFQFTRVPEGEYHVALHHAEYHSDEDNPVLHVGPEASPWFGVLRRGLTLEGIVVDKSGMALGRVNMALHRLNEDEEGKVINGFSKVARTAVDGSFQVRGIVPGTYRVTFIPGSRYNAYTQEIHSLSPPSPWRVVLEERSRLNEEGNGTLWVQFKDEDLHVSNLRVRVALYSLWDATGVASFSGSLEGGDDLYKSGVAPGIYTAVVQPEGYAPVILESVAITAAPSAPTLVKLSPGVLVIFEVEGPLEGGAIEVREARSGFVVSTAYPPPVKEGIKRIATRLETGPYLATLRTKGDVLGEKEFVLEAFADGSTSCVRFDHTATPAAAESEE